MNEITRIHIAKIPYDIELAAKKSLKTYTDSLARYANDEELLADIEIRITELLAERGIEKNGVITEADVAAVRSQLGEPRDFMGDQEDEAASLDTAEGERRLYRDLENAVLGGVLAGVANLFGLRAVWLRVAFVVLTLFSFGTAALIYIVLWAVIPPARTVAEKLQSAGRPVTLASLREATALSETVKASRVPAILKGILLVALGVTGLLVGVGALAFTVWMATLIGVGGQNGYYLVHTGSPYQWMGWLALSLLVLSGVLLAALGFLTAMAAFTRQFSKRIGIAVVVIIAAGIMAFTGGIGVAFAQNTAIQRDINDAIVETSAALPDGFSGVTQLTASAYTTLGGWGTSREMTIRYVATEKPPYSYKLTAVDDVEPHIVVNGTTARITLKSSAVAYGYGAATMPELVVYGPPLAALTVEQGNFEYTALPGTVVQKSLTLTTEPTTSVTVYGTYDSLRASGGGDIDVSGSALYSLTLDAQTGQVHAGVVRDLSLTQSDVCAAQSWHADDNALIHIAAVSSGVMTYNGQVVSAASHHTPCGGVTIGSQESE